MTCLSFIEVGVIVTHTNNEDASIIEVSYIEHGITGIRSCSDIARNHEGLNERSDEEVSGVGGEGRSELVLPDDFTAISIRVSSEVVVNRSIFVVVGIY